MASESLSFDHIFPFDSIAENCHSLFVEPLDLKDFLTYYGDHYRVALFISRGSNIGYKYVAVIVPIIDDLDKYELDMIKKFDGDFSDVENGYRYYYNHTIVFATYVFIKRFKYNPFPSRLSEKLYDIFTYKSLEDLAMDYPGVKMCLLEYDPTLHYKLSNKESNPFENYSYCNDSIYTTIPSLFRLVESKLSSEQVETVNTVVMEQFHKESLELLPFRDK